jgi:ABC-type transport system involved in cytochrome bd biosynthesis fused ATPase/permease subunit
LNTFANETITSQDIKRIQNKKNYSGNCNYNSNLTNGIAIKIQGLNFGYGDNALIKIQHYEFKINKFYIIIGESGVGKSTFLDLMLNIIKSDEGQIDYSIDSKKIGYVSQECFLLNDTIRKNIAFGVRENLIDDKKIDDVINKVNLSDFINKFPEKKNYKVTNNGSNISIGQKQRIGIARALYFEPDLIFFDEPTSSLDEFNEKLFLNIIDDIKKTSTVIMVTHKYKNMKNFDHLVELINGNLVEKKPS